MRPLLAAAALFAVSVVAHAAGADLKEANAAYRKKDFARALALYQAAADAGDPAAMNEIGLMNAKGEGLPKDLPASIVWFKKAADKGDVDAVTNLAYSYERGYGVARDPRAALKLYGEAARKGNRTALNNIGNMYERGDGGLVQDYVEAYKWYLLSRARGGSKSNAANIKRLADKMTKEQMAEAQKRASAFYSTATRGGAPSGPRSDVDRPAFSLPQAADDYAVVVGIEKYADLPPATWATRDALAVRDHLLALGYPARNVMLLSGADATKGRLTAALNSWLPNRVGPKSTVFFYYSGHGAPDLTTHSAYLVTADGQAEDLADTAYPVKLLYEKLSALKAKRVIVALDSCFSGAGGRSVLPKGARPLVTKVDTGSGDLGKVVSLSAAGGEQISGALDEQGHGAFTYYLLKGLDGAASPGGGTPTTKALFDYLSPKVQDAARLQNRDQTPQLAAGGSTDVPLR